MDIAADPQAGADWTAGLTVTRQQLPALTSSTEKTGDKKGGISYYKFYSNQASDFSLDPGSGRLGQLEALLQLGNGKTFRASNIDNYDWTPQGSDKKGTSLILEILKTAQSE